MRLPLRQAPLPRAAPRGQAGTLPTCGASMGAAPLRGGRGHCPYGLAADERHLLQAGLRRALPMQPSRRQRSSEHDEHEVGYSPRVEEAPSGAPIEKKSHKERLTMAETRLDVLEASLEELYQSQ
ncbi:hypothetical protein BHE74_00040461 [Ensete ventricosum]|nr:hypothetical protein BHE74_00040461 [Ensete ventricosum]